MLGGFKEKTYFCKTLHIGRSPQRQSLTKNLDITADAKPYRTNKNNIFNN